MNEITLLIIMALDELYGKRKPDERQPDRQVQARYDSLIQTLKCNYDGESELIRALDKVESDWRGNQESSNPGWYVVLNKEILLAGAHINEAVSYDAEALLKAFRDLFIAQGEERARGAVLFTLADLQSLISFVDSFDEERDIRKFLCKIFNC